MPGRHIYLSLSAPRAEALHQGLISTDIDEGVLLFQFLSLLRLPRDFSMSMAYKRCLLLDYPRFFVRWWFKLPDVALQTFLCNWKGSISIVTRGTFD